MLQPTVSEGLVVGVCGKATGMNSSRAKQCGMREKKVELNEME